MSTHRQNDGQFLFERNLRGLGLAARTLIYILIFCPLLFSTYWLATAFIPLSAPGYTWLAVILVGSFILYLLIMRLKALLLYLRARHNYTWIPIFLLCTAFTTVVPAIVFSNLFKGHIDNTLHWVLVILFTYFTYGQYNFLNTRLPFFRR